MKKIYLIFACLFILVTASSTTVPYNPGLISSTPQSQHFEKYLNHAVTEYHGLPDIQIPIHQITVKGVTIPIVMSYHAGGIKYRQYDGDIAAGWSISAGGFRVARTLKNRPDENSQFYSQTDLDRQSGMAAIDRYVGGMVIKYGTDHGGANGTNDNLDGEYDMFTYMTPTTSGNFIIHDRSNAASFKTTIMEGHNDIITLNVGNPTGSYISRSINGLTIKDDQGNNYLFGDNNLNYIERQTGTDWMYRLTPLAWTLKQIDTPHGETVSFTYEKFSPAVDWTWPSTLTIQDALTAKTSGPTTSYQANESQSGTTWSDLLFVKKIDTEYESVEFVRYGSSHSVAWERHLVKEILIKNKLTDEIKKISFNRKRLWSHHLLNFMEISYPNTAAKQKYTFSYYEPQTGKTEANTYPDQWGYYAWRESTDRTQGMLHNQFKDHFFVWETSHGTNQRTNRLSSYFNNWVNRSGNTGTLSATHLFSLRQVTFPTGGNTQYEYEENQYYSTQQRKNVKGAGQRVKKITSDPANSSTPVISEFRYGENENGIGTAAFPLEANVFGRELLNFPHTRIANESSFFLTRTYSTVPVGDATQSLFTVAYPKVTMYQYDRATNSYNGKTESTYTGLQKYTAEYMSQISPLNFSMVSNLMSPLHIIRYKMADNPRMTTRITYDKNNTMVQKEERSYLTTANPSFIGLKVEQQVWLGANASTVTLPNPGQHDPYHHVHQIYMTQPIYHQAGRALLKDKTVTQYPTAGGPIVHKEAYAYDTRNRLVKTTLTRSGSGTLVQEFTYPTSGALVTKNMLSTIVKTKTTNNGQAAGVEETTYSSTSIYPTTLKRSATNETTANLRTVATFNKYDSRGNLLQYTGADGVSTTYVWSYYWKHPVAEIINATYDEVNLKIPDVMSATASSRNPDLYMPRLANLRKDLPNAFITTFRYKPLVGMTERINPQGLKETYEYDGFGRLVTVKNNNAKTVNTYQYNHVTMFDPLALTITGGSNSFPVHITQAFTATVTGGSDNLEYYWEVKNASGAIEKSQAYSNNRNFSYSTTAAGQKTLKCIVRDKVTLKTKEATRTLTVTAAGPFEFVNFRKDESASTTTRHIYYATLKCPVTTYVNFRITFDGSSGCSAWFDFGNLDNYYEWPVNETLNLYRSAGDHTIRITVTSGQPYHIPSASLTITSVGTSGFTINPRVDRISIP